jgi:Putative Flp pilus-assembly TadE/G-like
MTNPCIRRSNQFARPRNGERGVTMILVAVAMVAIIAMAALSIDVITLYLAREEAQRSADNAALAAAKILSLSGLTGDPGNSQGNWGKICGPDDGVNGLASRVAKGVAGQDTVGGAAATTINISYSAGGVGTGSADCSSLSGTPFGINPTVTVQLTRASLPTFFSRIWGNTGGRVSAQATAETFNPSNSDSVGGGGTITPVQPRCVKPWVVPNFDPAGGTCDSGTCPALVSTANGAIQNRGMSLGGFGTTGIVGENLWLDSDCAIGSPGFCNPHAGPGPNYSGTPAVSKPVPNLLYVPGQVGTPVLAVPAACNGDAYQDAIIGCDQPANYSCGQPPASAPNPNAVDLRINPNADTTAGGQCLIHQTDPTNFTSSSGQDFLTPFAKPSSYPFQMISGSGNLTGLNGSSVSISSSIVSIPIYDQATPVAANTRTEVTFVGFLQVFINAVDQFGNINVTVLNVVGCGNGGTPVGTPQIGNSPVPVRLITPP